MGVGSRRKGVGETMYTDSVVCLLCVATTKSLLVVCVLPGPPELQGRLAKSTRPWTHYRRNETQRVHVRGLGVQRAGEPTVV